MRWKDAESGWRGDESSYLSFLLSPFLSVILLFAVFL